MYSNLQSWGGVYPYPTLPRWRLPPKSRPRLVWSGLGSAWSCFVLSCLAEGLTMMTMMMMMMTLVLLLLMMMMMTMMLVLMRSF